MPFQGFVKMNYQNSPLPADRVSEGRPPAEVPSHIEGSKLLIAEEPMQFLPTLAQIVGVNEAIVLQQIHYRLRYKYQNRDERTYRDGYYWVYNTLTDWHKEFPFWSEMTVRRILKSLHDTGLLVSTDTYNSHPMDKTKWYRIDYTVLRGLEEEQLAPVQPAQPMCSSCTEEVYNLNTHDREDSQRPLSENHAATTHARTREDPLPPTLHPEREATNLYLECENVIYRWYGSQLYGKDLHEWQDKIGFHFKQGRPVTPRHVEDAVQKAWTAYREKRDGKGPRTMEWVYNALKGVLDEDYCNDLRLRFGKLGFNRETFNALPIERRWELAYPDKPMPENLDPETVRWNDKSKVAQ